MDLPCAITIRRAKLRQSAHEAYGVVKMTDETIKFVQLIEKYPLIYNITLKECSRKDLTEKAWSEIAEVMKWSGAECKEKWKNIRNGFVRSLKPSPSGSSAKAKKPYYFRDILEFVLPYVRPVQHLEHTANFEIKESDVHHYEEVETTEDVDHGDINVVAEKRNHAFATPLCVENNKKRKRLGEAKDDVD
ncbi:uncharacterized protein LOC118749194 [Rhagoletis pomonella]|uniref:uncharacterized protein LOC118749194 n=1 Tax=Rhagoletis pomonella TaxID=28610 RepID=UPI00177F7B43|nr:uncharacterized protein LOC118749194 [Rhagoletis pomonella]